MMRAWTRFRGMLSLQSILALSVTTVLITTLQWGTVLPAAAQVSRRGFSSRGVNPAGPRTSPRGPTITGAARSGYNSGYRANTRGPLSGVHAPNVGGLRFDFSTPYYFPGDFSAPFELGNQGNSELQGENASPAGRPNVRPRLDVTNPDVLNSDGMLKGIHRTILGQIEACHEKPFTSQWYAAHPNVVPVKLANRNPWRRTNWAEASQLLNITAAPYRYDFRPDKRGLIFVYRNTVRRERAVDMRARSVELAQSMESSRNNSPPVSLGVFAAVPPVDKPVETLLFITLNASGTVSGQQYDFTTDSMTPLRGALERSSQRVAWQVGDDFFEAGLTNLTEDVSRALFFRADGWTQSWILMRISLDRS